MGEVDAYNQGIEFLNKLAFIKYCKVSRADLCVDRVMPLPDINRKTQIVTRLREKDSFYGGDYQNGLNQTGYQFGRGGIACRFYDKTFEISVKGRDHIKQIWIENGWDEKSSVCRFELQLRREGLRRFDVNMDFATFLMSKSDIWTYATGKYIRIVEDGSATRKERSSVTEYWKEYQKCATLLGENRGVLPYKQISNDWHALIKQADGCLASAWARLAADLGELQATKILEKEWSQPIPKNVIQYGMQQKTRFVHLS
jgi:hypothetical protein